LITVALFSPAEEMSSSLTVNRGLKLYSMLLSRCGCIYFSTSLYHMFIEYSPQWVNTKDCN